MGGTPGASTSGGGAHELTIALEGDGGHELLHLVAPAIRALDPDVSSQNELLELLVAALTLKFIYRHDAFLSRILFIAPRNPS